MIDLDNSPLTACVATPALAFDGDDDVVSIGAIMGGAAAALTVEMWVRHADLPNGNGAFQFLFAHTDGANDLWFGYHQSTHQIEWSFTGATAATASFDLSGPTGSVNGGWHHLAGTYDGAVLQIFVDGQPIGTAGAGAGTLVLGPTGNTIAGNGLAGDGLRGQLRSVRVSSTPVYTGSFTPSWVPSATGSTESLWRTTEGVGTTLNDSGPAANTGTIAGGATWITVP